MCEGLPAGTSGMYTMFMSGSCDTEKMLLYSMEMESQMIVKYHIDSGY